MELGIPEKNVYKYTYDCRKYMERLTHIYGMIAKNNEGKLFKIEKVKRKHGLEPQDPTRRIQQLSSHTAEPKFSFPVFQERFLHNKS